MITTFHKMMLEPLDPTSPDEPELSCSECGRDIDAHAICAVLQSGNIWQCCEGGAKITLAPPAKEPSDAHKP